MIGKRKRLLSYIKDKNVKKYQDLVKKVESEDDFIDEKKTNKQKVTQKKEKKFI